MFMVTGGAGFIGSNLAAGLEAERDTEVAVCDSLGTDEKWRNIAKRDLTDIVAPSELPEFVADTGSQLEAVFHLGAISTTTETDADLIIENNFRLSRDLWTLCTRHQIPFIYASSAATYGDGTAGFDDDESRKGLSRLQPLNAYGWSKHLFDRWVARQVNERGPAHCPPQYAGLKFFNVYGPNEYHKGGQISVALKNFREVSGGGPAVLFRSHHPDYADGGQRRDFVWVGDCVKVMLWLKDNPKVSGLFNLGTGKAESFADLAAALFAALKQEPEIRFVDTPLNIRDKYQYFTQANMKKLRTAGYDTPFADVQQGVRSYVRDYLIKDDPYL